MQDRAVGLGNDVVLTEVREISRTQSLAVSAIATGSIAAFSLTLGLLVLAAQS